MKLTSKSTFVSIVVGTAIASLSLNAGAQVLETDQASPDNGSFGTAFAGDIQPNLLSGMTAVTNGVNPDVGGFPLTAITDGTTSPAYYDNGDFTGSENLSKDPVLTYVLDPDTQSNPTGFTLTSIQTINGYVGNSDFSFADQAYTVSYALVANPSTFLPLATVNYHPFNPTATGGTDSTSSEVTLTNLDISGVKSIRFALVPSTGASGVNAQGGAALQEFQVFGSVTQIPEPSTYAMMLAGLGALGLAHWARRSLNAQRQAPI